MVGPTRTGKTTWARSLGPHLYWNGLFDLATFRGDVEYAIFDDFDWEFFPSYKQWLGAQLEFTVTDKYRKKKTIKWGKPVILLSNEMPRFKDMEWVQGNCFIVELNKSLF